jgi:stalled ribosome rescue protein Dom34
MGRVWAGAKSAKEAAKFGAVMTLVLCSRLRDTDAEDASPLLQQTATRVAAPGEVKERPRPL